MSTNFGQPDTSARITVECSCGKTLAGLLQHAGKRLKCPACGHAVVMPGALRAAVAPAAPPVEEEAEGFSKTTLIAMWTAVAAFALGCILFLVWYSDSTQQGKISAANDRISRGVVAADEWIARDSRDGGEAVERQLKDALASELAADKSYGEIALNKVRQRREQLAEQARIEQAQRQATAVFDDAKRQIDGKQITEAISLLHKYIADPHATERGEAQRLLAEAQLTISDKLTLDALIAISDEVFARAKTAGTIDDGKVTLPALLAIRSETIRRNLDEAAERRAAIRLAEEKRREAIRVLEERKREVERLAALERKWQEEERRRAQEAWRTAKGNRSRVADRYANMRGRAPSAVGFLGEPIQVGNIEWTVTNAERLGKVLRSDNRFTDNLTAGGQFVLVEMRVENRGSTPGTLLAPDVFDDEGRRFSNSTEARWYLPNAKDPFLRNLNPNVPVAGSAIYDVADDATGLSLLVGDLRLLGDAEGAIELGL